MLIADQRHLSSRELQMTDTELRAMAADAIQGSISTPTGVNTPAAIGIPEGEVERDTKRERQERSHQCTICLGFLLGQILLILIQL